MKVIKKDGTHEDYDFMKIRNAVTKSAKRVMIDLDDEACEALDLDMDDVMQTNIDKLKARYPEGFSADRSLHRKEGDI